MTWHGQINRTIWEIRHLIEANPKDFELRRELLRTHFLQRYEYDRSHHIPRDDRSFLFLQENRAPGCHLLHGAKGTPGEMRELGNYLYSKGFTVFCPRFSRVDLKERPASWESWVTLADSTYGSMRDYSRNTIVVGMGLGGTIGIILARLYEEIPALVLLAPAIVPRLELKERFVGLTRIVSPSLFTRLTGWNGEVIKATEHVRSNPQEIKCPTLVLQARDDRVVSSKGLKLVRKWASHKESEVALLPQGSHAITRSKSKDEVFDRVYKFNERLGLATVSD